MKPSIEYIDTYSDSYSHRISCSRKIKEASRKGLIPFGVELTWLPASYLKRFNEYCDEAWLYTTSDLVREKMKERGLSGCAHVDGHCLEISSPVFLEKTSFMNYCREVEKVVSECGKFVKHSPHVMSGCGHGHVTLPDAGACAALIRMVANNPWVGWAMQDTVDDEYAMNFHRYIHCELGTSSPSNNVVNLSRILFAPGYNVKEILRKIGNRVPDTRKFVAVSVVCGKNHHLELRQFRAARNLVEQEEHLDLMMAMCRTAVNCSSRDVFGHALVPDPFWVFRFSAKEACRLFLEFIEEIGLEPARYVKYTKNIRERYALGLNYLT